MTFWDDQKEEENYVLQLYWWEIVSVHEITTRGQHDNAIHVPVRENCFVFECIHDPMP